MQVLINQLKEVAPAIQKSISECTEKVNSISSNLPTMAKHRGLATSPIQAQSSGRTLVNVQSVFHVMQTLKLIETYDSFLRYCLDHAGK